jgi:hypothetical protein
MWMTNGRRFHVRLAQFAQILGLPSQLDIPKKLHSGRVIPRSEIEGTKPPYVCPGCFIHMYSNNMINRFHVQ